METQKQRITERRKPKRIIAMVLALVMIITMTSGMLPASQVQAAENPAVNTDFSGGGLENPSLLGKIGNGIASIFGFGKDKDADHPAEYAAGDQTTVADPSTLVNWKEANLESSTENIGRIWNDKTVSTEDVTLTGIEESQSVNIAKGDSDFLVGLSALSSMSNISTTVAKPVDIVLVLDDSGSMDYDFGSSSEVYLPTYSPNTGWGDRTSYYAIIDGKYAAIERVNGFFGGFDHWELNGKQVEPMTNADDTNPNHIQFYEHSRGNSRLNALHAAVSNFIDAAADVNAGITEQEKKIQISMVSFESNASILQGLTECEGTGVNALKAALTEMNANGATRADLGMERAEGISSNRPDAQKVVIFFTDGTPTSGNSFETTVANNAVSSSHNMKNTGTMIYSVGVFEGADASEPDRNTTNENYFMHAVSSNYPDATKYDQLGNRSENSNYYMSAFDSEGLNEVFQKIFEDVSSGTGSPTDTTDGYDPAHGGYITFTDQLGKYMKVDSFNDVVFGGIKFENPKKTTSENIDTYTFEGDVESPIYPNGNLKDLVITVQHPDSLAEGDLVTVKVPASLIPVRNFKVDTDQGTMDITDAYPIRVFYGVSLKDSVAEAIRTNNNGTNKLSEGDWQQLQAYVLDNKDGQGSAQFYSNQWNGNKEFGDTTATFEPAAGNSFYFFTEDTPVYTDEQFMTRAKESDLVPDKTLYYKDTYYEIESGNKYKEKIKPVSIDGRGFEVDEAYWDVDGNGDVYITAGAPHLTRTNDFFTPKADNLTGTANNAQNPTWMLGYNTMNSRLGNNGKLTVEVPGTLAVNKKIEVPAGFDPADYADTEFAFNIQVDGAGSNSYKAEVQNAEGQIVGKTFDLQFTDNVAVHRLKPGQTLYIYGLDSGSSYKVTEEKIPAGFTESAEGDTGIIVGGEEKTAAFTNTYGAAATEEKAYFTGSKKMEHRNFKDGDTFTFIVTAAYEGTGVVTEIPLPKNVARTDGKNSGTITINPISGNSENIDFGSMSFTAPGTYTYTIREQRNGTGIPGVTYSKAQYVSTVEVSDDHDGTMTAKVSTKQTQDDQNELVDKEVADNHVVFTNSYQAAEITRTIAGEKAYTDDSGSRPLQDNMFQFELRPAGENAAEAPMPEESVGDGADRVYTTENSGTSINFGRMTFTQGHVGKTYSYTVKEVIPDSVEDGMAYDQNTHNVTIAVTQNAEGEIEAAISYPEGMDNKVVFTNSYDPKDVTLSGNDAIGGTKTLTGRDMKGDESFTFTLLPKLETQSAIDAGWISGITEKGLSASVQGGSNGTSVPFVFGDITFTHVGKYTFELKETVPETSANGLTYDTHTCTVTVHVTDKQGQLEASVDYGTYNDKPANEFFNTYKASMDFGGQGGLKVEKTLNGRNMKMNEFDFTITGVNAADSTTTAKEADEKLQESDRNFSNPTNANAGEALTMDKLQKVIFSQDDAGKTYTYEVAETQGAAGGVTYDTTVYTVAVQVLDNGDGTMHTITTVTNKATQESEAFDSANSEIPVVGFTNTYAASSVTVPGTGFSGTKTLRGRDGKENEIFGFAMTLTSGNADGVVGLDENSSLTAVVSNLVKGQAAPFNFSNLTFTKAGTYTFSVTETAWNETPIPAGDTEGIKFDRHSGTITVEVTDPGDGQLAIKGGQPQTRGTSFINRYETADQDFDIAGTVSFQKILSGRGWQDTDSFTFTMTGADGAPMPEGAENGTKTVTLDNQTEADGESVEVDFGDIGYTFEDLAGETQKTFTYTISEQTGSIPGVTYSGAVFVMEVTVSDNGDGTLGINAQVKQTRDDEGNPVESSDVENAVFTNTYSAEGTEVTLAAAKEYNDLSGNKPLADGMFQIQLVPTGDNAEDAPMPQGTEGEGKDRIFTAGNTGTAFTIPSIPFDQHDSDKTYTYQVSEVKGNEAGMTYDKNVYDIAIKVTTDTSTGKPVIKTEVTGVPEGGMVFTNTYDPEDVVLGTENALKVQKTLSGRDSLKDESFTFTLTLTGGPEGGVSGLENKKLTQSVKDLQDGKAEKASFGNLTFSKPGTYTFEVNEEELTAGGLTCDTHISTISVNVVDKGGKLELAEGSPSYDNSQALTEADKAVNDAAAFTNTYKASGSLDGNVNLEVTKELKGRKWQDGDSFEFTLKAGDEGTDAAVKAGDVILPQMKTLTVDNANTSHKAAFGNITFNKKGTYVFEITETKGNLSGIKYDEAPRLVTVKVTDNGDGTLNAEVESIKGGSGDLTFTNTYSTDGSTVEVTGDKFAGTKTLNGRNSLKDETFGFTMELTDGDANNIEGLEQTGVNFLFLRAANHLDAAVGDLQNGTPKGFSFDNLTFKAAGTYKFKVTENRHNDADLPNDGTNGMIYDRHEGTVTVTVTDTDPETGLQDGALHAAVSSENMDFVNSYAAEPAVWGRGQELLGGDKFMDDETGGFVFEDNQFTFVMRGQAKEVPMPEELKIEYDSEGRPVVHVMNTRVDDTKGAYDFGEIIFEQADMTGAADNKDGTFTKRFQYNIFEGDSTVPGVTQDNTAYTVTFTVIEDQNKGTMTVTPSAVKITPGSGENTPVDMDKLDFTNTHKAGEVSGYQNIFKTLDGRDFQKGDKFVWDISMTAVDEAGVPMTKENLPTVTEDPSADFSPLVYTETGDGFSYTATITPENTATGNTYRFSIGKITYKHVGTYTYTIKEQAGSVPGVDYDNTVYTVKVTITEENGALKRVAEITPEPSADGTLDFTNTYDTGTIGYTEQGDLNVTKKLTGRDMEAGEFQIKVSGNEVDMARAGLIDTEAPQFEKVAERIFDVPAAKEGELAVLNPLKAVSFSLDDVKNNTKLVYTISEAAGTNDAVTYDESSYVVTLWATDNHDGTLKIHTSIAKDGGEPAEWENPGKENPPAVGFENAYKKDDNVVLDGTANMGVKKILEGRKWTEEDEFTFKLSAKSGPEGADPIPMPEGAQNGETTVQIRKNQTENAFGDITYTEPGTYVYEISEVENIPAEDGMTYDKSVYTVTVHVAETATGKLLVNADMEQTAGRDGAELDAPIPVSPKTAVFTNTSEKEPGTADFSLKGTKSIKGRDFQTGDSFTFTVKAEDNAPMPSLVDESGNVTITPESGKNADVDFGTIKFTEAGEYVYKITEQKGNAEGMTYDTAKRTVTVIVTEEKDETLKAEAVYSDGEQLVWTNVYEKQTAVSDPLTVRAEKNLKGEKLKAGEFTFRVTPLENAPMGDAGQTIVENEEGSEVNAEDISTGTFNVLTNVVYSKAGAYKYLVEEVNDGRPEVIYDTTAYQITVTVEEKDGVLKAEPAFQKGTVEDGTFTPAEEADAEAVVFNNAIRSETATAPVTVQKVLEGKPLEAEMFSFEISTDAKEGVILPEPTTVKNDAEGNVSFGDVTFTKAGNYEIRVKEVIPEKAERIPGVIYTDDTLVLGYTVTGQPDGSLVWKLDTITWEQEGDAQEGTDGSAVFVNRYEAEAGSIDGSKSLTGTKTLNGRDSLKGESFGFTLEAGDELTAKAVEDGLIKIAKDADKAAVSDLKDGEAAGFSFGNITFEKGTAGQIYVFHVTENLPDGVSAENPVKDGVTYDTHAGTYKVTVKDDGSGILKPEVDAGNTEFINTYDAQAAVGVPAGFSLQKVFDGRAWTEDYAFQFTLTPVDNAPMPANGADTVTVNAPTEEDGHTAVFNFGEIEYTEAGAYSYKVTETAGDNPGIKYDTHEAVITVTVTDDLAGQLNAAAEVENGTFTNTYHTGTVDYNAEGGLQIVKNLTGRAMEAGQFEFTLKASNDEAQELLGGAEKTVSNNPAELAGADGNISTDMIKGLIQKTFTLQDAGKTYEFTVAETKGGADGYTNDPNVYNVSIAVTDEGNGVLTVTTSVNGEVKAVYTGEASAAARELNPVTLTFNNTYDAGSETIGGEGDAAIRAAKTLINRPMTDGEFHFIITDKNGTQVAEGWNSADGTVTFGAIEYTTSKMNADVAAGIAERSKTENGDVYSYQYTVSEDESSFDEGVTVIDGAFTVTVNVTDDGNGHLSAAVVYPDGKDSLEFINEYGAGEGGEVKNVIKGSKVLNVQAPADNAPDITGKYTFTLSGSEGAPMPEKTQAVNDAAGNVDFGAVIYTMENVFGDSGRTAEGEEDSISVLSAPREKTFTYTVTESGNLAGVSNDPAEVKTITVTVRDNGDGTLTATKAGDPGASAGMDFTFTNTYSVQPTDPVSPTDSAFKLTKELEGRSLKAGEFEFVLTEADSGLTVMTGTNDADGNVALYHVDGTPGIVFDRPGTYQYVLSEKAGELGGVTYDGSQYNVAAVVKDNGDGTMSVQWMFDGAESAEITFHNTYKAEGTSVVLGAVKKLKGRDLKAGEFTFELKDEAGTVISKAVNDKDGAVQFDVLNFEKAGTYIYTVSEVKADDKTITYDDTVYKVTVTVEDPGDGYLKASVDNGGNKLVFKNIYTKPEVPKEPEEPASSDAVQTGDSQSVLPAALAAIIALIVIAGIVVAVVRRRKK